VALLLVLGAAPASRDTVDRATDGPVGAALAGMAAPMQPPPSGGRVEAWLHLKRGEGWAAPRSVSAVGRPEYRMGAPAGWWTIRGDAAGSATSSGGDRHRGRGPPAGR